MTKARRYQEGYVQGHKKGMADCETEIERLRTLLNDKTYIQCKADYNRGHLSHANYLDSRERGLNLDSAQ